MFNINNFFKIIHSKLLVKLNKNRNESLQFRGRHMKFSTIIIIFLLLLNSCYDKENHSDDSIHSNINSNSEKKIPITRESENSKFYGISTQPSIQVADGRITFFLKEGILPFANGDKLQAVIGDNQLNLTFSLIEVNNLNILVEGSFEKIHKNEIIFVPSVGLKSTSVYKINLKEENTKRNYTEIIYIAAANYCNPNSYLSKVMLQGLPQGSDRVLNLEIKQNTFVDLDQGVVSAIAWNHNTSNNFYFSINNQTPSAKYKILAVYGVYNIPGHECELYLQRETGDLFLTWTDANYGTKKTMITNEDTAIKDIKTQKFYNFGKTFILIKVLSAENSNITAQDNGVLTLEQTDNSYELPVSVDSEEESSLLAYLNRGNNNNYSMVLGGLIVGIFGFFLSRKLINKDDENDSI